jgi:hypothetical protein
MPERSAGPCRGPTRARLAQRARQALSEHADVEALSAFVDGEAPEWADHVERCQACAASAEAMRAVSGAVATPVDPPAPAVRERAIRAALAPSAPVVARRRRALPTRWLVPAMAAMILLMAGAVAVVTMGGRSSSHLTDTVAGPLSGSKATESGAPAPAADSFAANAPVTDLGDVPDAATLAARARPGLSSRTASGPAASAATASPVAPAPSVPPAAPAPATLGVPAPAIVGTRPCEEQARARQPSLGPVVYFATARRQGVPAVVLGFSTGPDPAQVTLLMLAQDGCGELLRVAGP